MLIPCELKVEASSMVPDPGPYGFDENELSPEQRLVWTLSYQLQQIVTDALPPEFNDYDVIPEDVRLDICTFSWIDRNAGVGFRIIVMLPWLTYKFDVDAQNFVIRVEEAIRRGLDDLLLKWELDAHGTPRPAIDLIVQCAPMATTELRQGGSSDGQPDEPS